MKKVKAILFNHFVSIFVVVVLVSGFQSCEKEEEVLLPPSFSVNATAEVQVSNSVEINVSSISAPGLVQSVTASVTSGGGSVSVSDVPAGESNGSAKVTYSAPEDAGVATIDITVTDQEGQSDTKTVAVNISAAPVATVADITGITVDPSADGFALSKAVKNGVDVIKLVGDIDRDITLSVLDGYEWLISGSTFINDEATLTIDEGVKLYFDAESSATSFLVVAQNAEIQANGTSSAPILMTSSNELGNAPVDPDGGDWGGFVLNGLADINVGDSAEGEGGTGVYGGNDDGDSSGSISYVILKYAGRIIGVDNELNGFSFNGVGSGTNVDHIQSYYGEDDGIEFFGGAVNVKYAVSTGSKDDSFDWTHGWRGKAQFIVIEQTNNRGDRGFECDNLEGNFAAEPYSNPLISNVTIVNSNGNEGETYGFRLRHGTKGKIYNALANGSDGGYRGIRVDKGDDLTDEHMNDGSLVVANSIVWGYSDTNWKDAEVFEVDDSNSSTDPGVLTEAVGVVTAGAKDASTIDTWFDPVSFIGAVDPSNNWLSGWALKTDGTTTY
jgi:hypothetical protein